MVIMELYFIFAVFITILSTFMILWSGVQIFFFSSKYNNKWQKSNFIFGVIHVLSACVLAWLAQSEEDVWEAPVYSLVSVWQNATNGTCSDSGACYVDPQVISARDLPIAIIAVLFGIISGYMHLFVAGYDGDALQHYCETGSNPFRWADYMLSSSLMIIVIASLSGVLDVFLLPTLSVLQFYLMYGAYMAEKALSVGFLENDEVRQEEGIITFRISSVAYACGVWVPIIGAFYQSLHHAPNEVPEWINIMIWSLFGLFTSFAIVMWYYLIHVSSKMMNSEKSVKTRLMAKQELMYMFLSMAAKLTLHWVLFTGITSRSGVLFSDEASALSKQNYHTTGKDNGETTMRVTIAALASIVFSFGVYYYTRTQILKDYPKASTIESREMLLKM